MDKDRAEELLKSAIFKFAKSMPKYPHEYTLRRTWENDKEFVDVVMFIRKHGKAERFWKKTYIYYYMDGYKYWTMGCPTHNCEVTGTILINRAKIET